MKKFLLAILLALFSFTYEAEAQTVLVQDWTIENNGEWGSFKWGVTRSTYPDYYGKYYYYVYFYSNSYFNSMADGIHYDKASTYIKNVNITMHIHGINSYGQKVWTSDYTYNLPYVSCDWYFNANAYGAWFSSNSPYNLFSITFDKAKAWDYSIY